MKNVRVIVKKLSAIPKFETHNYEYKWAEYFGKQEQFEQNTKLLYFTLSQVSVIIFKMMNWHVMFLRLRQRFHSILKAVSTFVQNHNFAANASVKLHVSIEFLYFKFNLVRYVWKLMIALLLWECLRVWKNHFNLPKLPISLQKLLIHENYME